MNTPTEETPIVEDTSIGEFTLVKPIGQSSNFIIPNTHTFQKIIEQGEELLQGGRLPDKTDFTGYVPIAGSSENGYLSINSESTIGGVSVLDIHFAYHCLCVKKMNWLQWNCKDVLQESFG